MTAIAVTDVDLEALEQDAKRTLGELTEARARLVLDALTDATVAAELEDVESEIRSCEQVIERAQLAHGEQGRRAAAAAAEAARAAREAAAARVAELTAELQTVGAQVDAAFAAMATAVGEWLRLGELRDQVSVAAGGRPGTNAYVLRAIQLDGAFRFAMRRAPMGVLGLEGFVQPRSIRPLVEIDEQRGCGENVGSGSDCAGEG